MTIRPEDLTVSALPRSPLPGGIKQDAVADLLERTAWDYRTALAQAQELTKARDEQARRIEELEAQNASLAAEAATRRDPDELAGQLESARRELEQLRSERSEPVVDEEAIGKALLAATRAGEEIVAEAHAAAERITAEAEARATAILEQAMGAAAEREREGVAAREKLEIELAEARAAVEKENAAAWLELERARERTLEEAEEEADRILSNARGEVEQLKGYSERLRSLVLESQHRFGELAESALRQLEAVGTETAAPGQGDLLDDLRAAGGEPSASAVTGE